MENDMNVVMEADKQAEIFQRFFSLAEKIRPQLRADGANFKLWSKNMLIAWTTYFMGDSDYFQQPISDDNVKRNLVAHLFIQHSVNSNIYEAVTSLVYHANFIFSNSSDWSENINDYAMTITEAIQNLENQLGPIDSETLTTLAIYFAVPSMHQLITATINTLMATNPNIKVCPDDLLNMIRQISMASPSFDHSTEIARLNAASKFGQRNNFDNRNPHFSTRPASRSTKIPSSSRQVEPRIPNSRFPCHYCSEVGHWSPQCPIKAKAIEMKARAQRKPANIASMGVVPSLEDHEALLDSGATHSVVGELSLFASLTATDMVLSVASSESFKVNGIGTIVLDTPHGPLCLNNVLYCRHIPGILLSLGHLLNENFSISFLNNLFTISFRSLKFFTVRRNNQWFIPLNPPTAKSSLNNPLSSAVSIQKSANLSSNDDSMLWHKRVAHLSLRHLKHMQKSNAANGIPNVSFHDIKLCHDCSIAKSQHRPIKTASHQSIKGPGDLMGPYGLSLNQKKYILMILDAFSHVVVAIPLSDKSESKTYLINWMKQFMNVTPYKIKTLRTDNGTEFKNSVLNDFLTQHGIIHEYSMPYEHHQNGRIEQTN
ncbi:hypothetical protein O181_105895 [Austropuccinia psidii MF-1]|uniref:Integrase catalytic domain-containing protein n=1 Tax=Austropuccinia psidii MF-1 TaxID=1389203 RepID=A0A9Q3PM36_9BASI|nr:hypothetical protein [Austropuccinia psidii MF-1]